MGSFISVRLLYSFLTHKNKIKSSPLICCAGGRWCINPSGSEQPAHSVDARILMIWQDSEYRRRDKPLQHFKRSQWVLIFPLQGPPYADTLFLAQFLAMTAWHFERQIRQLTCCRKIEEKKSCLCAASTFFFLPWHECVTAVHMSQPHSTDHSGMDTPHPGQGWMLSITFPINRICAKGVQMCTKWLCLQMHNWALPFLYRRPHA